MIADLAAESEEVTVTITHGFEFESPDDELADLKSVRHVMARFDEHGITYELRDE